VIGVSQTRPADLPSKKCSSARHPDREENVRIGIIGAGRLGGTLAERLVDAGHDLTLGGGASAQEAGSRLGIPARSAADAAAFGEVVVLAVPFDAVDDALAAARPPEGQVLWSCVNALKPDYSGLAVGFDTSAAEQVARRASRARVVAAIPPFAEALASGGLAYDRGLVPSVFLCGDDGEAKEIVASLVVDLGAHPVDAGPLAAARLVEPAMMLLVSIAYAGVPRDVGLRLLERGARVSTATSEGSR
jgi:8-hydroxy-5-deazaflavin:NADPH oxidoreductase